MIRDFAVLKGELGNVPGDEEAASRATALANIADAPTIEKLVQAFAMFDLVGGQLYVQARRFKYRKVAVDDPESPLHGEVIEERIPDEEVRETPGEWRTVGFVFRFETADTSSPKPFTVLGPIDVEPDKHDEYELASQPPEPEENGAVPVGAEGADPLS